MALPRHPDTIPDLATDCRRILRDDYAQIQIAVQGNAYLPGNQRSWETAGQHAARCAAAKKRQQQAIGAAIAEYRRTAALWGVEV